MPCQDLLKCIHYFASTYYSEMGQLRDSSKEYRREKKLRRLKKLERLAARTAARLRPGLQQNHDAQDEDNEAGSSKDDISDTDEESSVGKVKKVSKRRQAKPLVGTDMYKIFDGSALMTIGEVQWTLCSLAC
ncbi:uncharacterized protein PHACADRAFT_158312 [Phanerochaete carnosa HHB-10118-sp]|uniref:Uncharacterized protein n=1 Tax=Phanerochaete carnosa (strain HHB-10118-sp) TaxID=650164 RepID=K5XAF6_PHACS|nr:uncharacterized protein PHACADRAFT_158312 [Phanerochaete carnosa HHB-10118-sp]EKM59897.1 hypothetical protein PHACADRAFT_158312 [Phanerochaete carnosa HHB-10118-sp]